MNNNNTDVDLYKELAEALKSSEEEETSGAFDQKPTIDNETIETPNIEENDDLSEEEISKLSERAQKRIRDLAAQVKELAEKPEKEIETSPQDLDQEEIVPQSFKNVQEFLEAVQDEPSRNLLEKFYETMKGEISSTLSPIEKANNEAKFDSEFSKYEKVEGLSDYKNDLKKTFLRNPNQNIKSLISETITDLVMNKVTPIEKTPSTPKRGQVDTSNLSKDELYDVLDTLRG